MKTAMIDEQRADAHVVVYGDASPITEQEWHLAALWAHVGELLTTVMEECAAWAAGGE